MRVSCRVDYRQPIRRTGNYENPPRNLRDLNRNSKHEAPDQLSFHCTVVMRVGVGESVTYKLS